MKSDAQIWHRELAIWIVVDIAVAVAFGVGVGRTAGILTGGVALLVTAAVHFGRRRVDAARVASGVGDERTRSLYAQANAATAVVLWAVITIWWLITVVQGDQHTTLLVLVILQAASFFGASLYFARRS